MPRRSAFIAAIAALTLAALPLAVPATAATVTALGDLAPLHIIVADTLTIAEDGDMPGAERRLTDFETAWDDAASTMRPLDAGAWTVIDRAADTALDALRSRSPSKDIVVPALNNLLASLDDPTTASGPVPAAASATFTVTDADGNPVPCEVALEELRKLSATTVPADQAAFDTLQSKGIERCNSDDDKRADKFFADAFAMLGH